MDIRQKAVKKLCRLRVKKINVLYGYIFIAPVIVGMLLFTFWPLIESLYTSFTLYDSVSAHEWVGFRNYAQLLFTSGPEKDLFLKSLGTTMLYAVISIPLNIFFSFFLALLLNTKLKGIKIFRALFYVPCILPMAASVLVFKELFSYNGGWFNNALVSIGASRYGFFSTEQTALPSLIIYSLSPDL